MAEAADEAQMEGAAAAGPGQKKHSDEQLQGLEKVTDYVEEQEISGLTQVLIRTRRVRYVRCSPHNTCLLRPGSDKH